MVYRGRICSHSNSIEIFRAMQMSVCYGVLKSALVRSAGRRIDTLILQHQRPFFQCVCNVSIRKVDLRCCCIRNAVSIECHGSAWSYSRKYFDKYVSHDHGCRLCASVSFRKKASCISSHLYKTLASVTLSIEYSDTLRSG